LIPKIQLIIGSSATPSVHQNLRAY